MQFSTILSVSILFSTHIALAIPVLPGDNVSTAPTTTSKPPPPAFAADPSINIAGIYAAAQAAGSNDLATYPLEPSHRITTTIFGDWLNLPGVAAFHFIADMNIDCDGPEDKCKGNRDGQSMTSFGALDATKVPYFVLPDRFTQQNKDILKPNALGAIICNGQMFYGIYGDQNADSPQIIGEASILIGQTCFPEDNISGSNGHAENDIAYIVFGTQVPSGVEENTIDISALKALGDSQVNLLQAALQL
ncbi:fungal chitosanase of glycosyl hydrolase group 75-domain-containing protein [Roridomyces roridus]|uniref:Endo-chitosanase n=1 Tax=Roridomyces roridus TaxID=1738132 RepID=A0AAD7FHN1_9AGAR|nr:fungal chitosanase of glycosyl hydrolase group 75-domain-containing protein [Roridomyces roridus]